jgi:hypothetical protein
LTLRCIELLGNRVHALAQLPFHCMPELDFGRGVSALHHPGEQERD